MQIRHNRAALRELIRERRPLLAFKGTSAVEASEELHERRDEPGPSGLMPGPETGAVVAMKVLMEEDVIPPVRIVLELRRAAEHRAVPSLIPQKDPGQTRRELPRDFEEGHHPARSGWALHFEFVAIVGIELQERPVHQDVDRHPDRAAPVRVAAEHASV